MFSFLYYLIINIFYITYLGVFRRFINPFCFLKSGKKLKLFSVQMRIWCLIKRDLISNTNTLFNPKHNYRSNMNIIRGIVLVCGLFMIAALPSEAVSQTDTKLKEDVFIAIRSIDYTSLNILLSDGTDVDTVDKSGNTPLMVAAKIGNPRILTIILSHGPNLDMQNKSGKTALMIAAETGQLHVVKELVQRGADISVTDANRNTAVTLASTFGHEEIVQYLKNGQSVPAFTK